MKQVSENRFEVSCVACHRASPIVPGPPRAAAEALKAHSWGKDVDDAWVCPVCLGRSTAKRKSYDR